MKKVVSSLLDEIINEANSGKISIGDWKFFVRFYIIENGNNNIVDDEYPILEINGRDALISKLEKYLLSAEEFYKENKIYYDLSGKDFYKRLLLDLISSASRQDLVDFHKYVERKTLMFDSHVNEGCKKVGEISDIEVFCDIKKNRSYFESLYNMDLYFKRGEEIYYLPSINFSFIDNICYLGSVQRKHTIENNSLSKKLDRYFRKVNKGVDEESDIYNISPSALVSLTIFSSLIKNYGVNKVVSSTYMPIRYYGYRDKLPFKKGIDYNEAMNRLDLDQYNMTNKLMNLLLRYNYHFKSGCEFDDINDEMNLNIDNIDLDDNNIICEIYNMIDEYIREEKIANGRINKSK